MSRRRQTRPGDVYELVVDAGFAYVQAIWRHPEFGWAMRVLSPLPRSVGNDAACAVSEASELFVSLMGNVALEAAEGRIRFVGSTQLPNSYDGSPLLFRASIATDNEGRHVDGSWWLDDGTKEWRVGTLTEEQQRLPFRQLVPALALRVLIDAGWDPQWEFTGPDAREFQKSPRWNQDSPAISSFYLYFPRAANAQSAAKAILADGRVNSVSVLEPSDDESPLYSVVAESGDISVQDLADIDDYFEHMAARFDGTYDGNELPLDLRATNRSKRKKPQ